MAVGALEPIHRWQILDNGTPSAGAKAYFYLSGTDTPQPVYSDSSLTTPRTNPVVADAEGVLPVIYFAAVAYRVLITDANGVTIFPAQDNVYDFAQVQLSQSGGAALVGYIQSGVGAVERTVQSRLRDLYSVKDFGAIGDGVTNDAAALQAAVTAVAALTTGGTVYVPSGTYLIGTNVTVPVNVSLSFMGGRLSISTGITVTVSGSLRADRAQIVSGAGSLDLTDAKLDWVYPEWWGAVALKAASGTPADSTTAIEAAINSKRNVALDQGIYGTTGGHTISTDGQIVRGQGVGVPADGQGGTTLYRLSGTNTIITGGSFIGCELGDLILDGNSLGGSLCRWQSIYSTIRRVRFRNQGGTSYALFVSATNVSTFDQLTFVDGNYGHIASDNSGGGTEALYATFQNLVMGSVNGGKAIYLQKAVGWNLFGVEGDNAPILIEDNCQAIRFYGYRAEFDTDILGVHINGTTNLNISFSGVRVARTFASTNPPFKITSAFNTAIQNVFYNDLVSAANHPFITLDGAMQTVLSNIEVYTQNVCDVVSCSGTRSDRTLAENLSSNSGAAGRCNWKVSTLSVQNSSLDQAFQAGSENIFLNSVTGTITPANAQALTIVNGVNGTPLTFTASDATPSLIGAAGYYKTNNALATTITAFDDPPLEGSTFVVIVGDANTTFDFTGTTLKGNNGADFTAASGDALRFLYQNGNFYATIIEA